MMMDDFVASARAFLDGAAERRHDSARAWGSGSDRVTYFSDDVPDVAAEKVQAGRAWQRRRWEAGFGWITGPAEYGGAGLTTLHQLAYDTVEAEYDVPDTGVLSVIGLGMIGPTILTHGTPAIRDRYLAAMYRGEVIACQLFSEPGAGSDLAGVETRAVRDGDSWRLDGQKVWTSVAQHADIGMALCRTDPDQPKHRGITAFLLDLRAPGVEVRPLRQMSGGAEFNEVFLTDVVVSDDHRLGDVGNGWRVALTTLMNERATVGGGQSPVAGALSLPYLVGLLKSQGRDQDPAARRALAEFYATYAATGYLNRQARRRLESGEHPGPEASVSKLMYARNLTRGAHLAAEIAGPKLVADTGEWGTFAWTELLLSVPALRILGGTEEIMMNILAERVLGLPKEPGVDPNTPFRELKRAGGAA
ncbi:acyl-CoA dehydrogenase family protein [Cryptosporangium sp. NPDC051539]|uniref:acyl-CoA dehydrogenase family protein n=1 Tax=Cryptosporangium sp. NPDC051539 TaxID=3363962 RepID=UPI0037B6673B